MFFCIIDVKIDVNFIVWKNTNLSINYLIFSNTGYKLLAYVAATACGMTANYLGQRFIVFERKNK